MLTLHSLCEKIDIAGQSIQETTKWLRQIELKSQQTDTTDYSDSLLYKIILMEISTLIYEDDFLGLYEKGQLLMQKMGECIYLQQNTEHTEDKYFSMPEAEQMLQTNEKSKAEIEIDRRTPDSTDLG